MNRVSFVRASSKVGMPRVPKKGQTVLGYARAVRIQEMFYQQRLQHIGVGFDCH